MGDAVTIEESLNRWVEAGLVTSEQAEAIRSFEHLGEPAPPRRLTLVAEIATYLGGVIAFAGGAAVVGPNWERLGWGGQVALSLAIAVVAFAAGWRLAGVGEPGTRRISWFLWAVGTGGVGLASASVVSAVDPRNQGWYPFAIGTAVAVVSLALWRNRDRPLQLFTAGVGLLMVLLGSGDLLDVSTWFVASAVWLLAAALGVLAAVGAVQPRLEALAIASIGLMIGSFVFTDVAQTFSAILAVATAGAIVTYAMVDRSIALVAIGVGAFFIATTSMMQTVLHGTTQRLIAALLGLAVVTAVAMRSQRLSGSPRS